MYVQNQKSLKTFLIFKNGTKTPEIANLHSSKPLLLIKHLPLEKKLISSKNDQIWSVVA